MKKVAIWGCNGFVGGTAYRAFKQLNNWTVLGYDLNNSPNTKEECYKADLHFICVPTPMKKDTGECDTSIVESVINDLAHFSRGQIVVKSTVPVQFCESIGITWIPSHPTKAIFFNPEFLTEANAYNDFVNLEYQIIGCPPDVMKTLDGGVNCLKDIEVYNLYKDCEEQNILKCKIYHFVTTTYAEMIKLARNCYLATRLSFFNEIKQICDATNIEYDSIRGLIGLDSRVGNHFNKVPGPDGIHGWGLSCFPKDINDLMFVANKVGVDPKVMRAVWQKNLEVREIRDWENMPKAVS